MKKTTIKWSKNIFLFSFLKKFPIQYIHEPWTAPLEVQITAKCIIGRDYPVPMVDHSAVSRINTERLRQVYQQLYKQYGKGEILFIFKK